MQECRLLHDLPPDAQIIGYVGRFETIGMGKGLSMLIDAVGILKREYQLSPTLVCVGGPMDPVPDLIEAGRAAGISGTTCDSSIMSRAGGTGLDRSVRRRCDPLSREIISRASPRR